MDERSSQDRYITVLREENNFLLISERDDSYVSIYTPEGILSDLIPLLRESSLFRKHLSSYGFDNLVDLFSL